MLNVIAAAGDRRSAGKAAIVLLCTAGTGLASVGAVVQPSPIATIDSRQNAARGNVFPKFHRRLVHSMKPHRYCGENPYGGDANKPA